MGTPKKKEEKERTHRNWTKNLKLRMGRLLGVAKQKKVTAELEGVYDAWVALCHQNNMNLTDRFLDLAAWDLGAGGVDLREVVALKADLKVTKAKHEADIHTEYVDQIQRMTHLRLKDVAEVQERIAANERFYTENIQQKEQMLEIRGEEIRMLAEELMHAKELIQIESKQQKREKMTDAEKMRQKVLGGKK